MKFLSRGNGYSLFLTATEAVISLRKPLARPPERDAGMPASQQVEQAKSAVVRMKLVGANRLPEISGLDELPGKSNYLVGSDPKEWLTSVPLYGKVRYKDVYPGVDLVYYGNQGQLEYDLVVAPGADPSSIRLEMAGAHKLELNPQGDLIMGAAGDSEIRLRKPVVYQQVAGRRREVAGNYVLLPNRQVRFALDGYDRSQPLIVDPVLAYSTFLGGSNTDYGYGIAVDSSGAVYVTGQTASIDFPTTPGAYDSDYHTSSLSPGGGAAFVAKLDTNQSGTASLVYSTFLGLPFGSAYATAIAVDGSGNAYVTGFRSGGYNSTAQTVGVGCNNNASGDFITKLNSTGSALVYSVCLDSYSGGQPTGIAVDSGGNAYVSGLLSGGGLYSPVNGFDAVGPGWYDAYVTKLSSDASAILYSTYLAGAPHASCEDPNIFNPNGGYNAGLGIAVDSAGNAYVTGLTNSCAFPTTPGAYQTTKPDPTANYVAFAAKINTNAAGVSSLVYSTFLGGDANGGGNGIAVDSSGAAYIVGYDTSDTPRGPGAYQSANNLNEQTAFLAKLNAAGSALLYSTYLGASDSSLVGKGPLSTSQANAIAVDGSGNAYLTGWTHPVWLDFPTVGAFQPTFGGGYQDAFVAQINTLASGSASLVFSSYLGGSGGDSRCLAGCDWGTGIALDPSGNVYVTGYTGSADFPTVNPLQPYKGSLDAFVAKISIAPAAVTVTVDTAPTGLSIVVDTVQAQAPQFYSWTPGSNHTLSVVDPQPAGTGTQLKFASWSNGGSLTQTVTAPSSPTTYTATFNTQYLLTTAANPPAGGSITAGGWFNAGAPVGITATPAAGQVFTGFTGDLTGITNPQTINMTAPKNVTANFKTATTTTVSSLSPNPATYGQAVTITAAVSSASGTPTGTVMFYDGPTNPIGSGTLDLTGHASVIIPLFPAGPHSISTSYGGDATFSSSTSTAAALTVNQAASSTAIGSSVNPSVFGQSVTFTATVSSLVGVPTGTVTFMDGVATLGSSALNLSGQAVLMTSTLTVGGHTITAVYGGDVNFLVSSSPVFSQTVNKAPTTTTLSSAPNPSSLGQPVSFTATVVSSTGGIPTGTVALKEGGTTLASGTLVLGQTTVSVSSLSAGSHTLKAIYAGDSADVGSTSNSVKQVVNLAPTTTSVGASPNPSLVGQPVTLTATLVWSGTVAPTGTVTFKDAGKALGTGVVNASGQASFGTSALKKGTHSITAVYSGDSVFAGSTSPAITQTVN